MRTIKYKILLLITMLGLALSANAQAVGSWKQYQACQKATKVVETNTLVFALYESLYDDGKSRGDGALVSYDPDYDEVYVYSLKDGLSDVGIKLMEYSPEHGALILVYNSGNIDIFFGQNDVINNPSIISWSDPDKTINRIDLIGDYAYISTAFGIVVLDIERGLIIDTYRTGAEVRTVCKKGNYLYAATTNGLRKGLLNNNLIDHGNWIAVEKEELDYPGDFSRLRGMFLFNDLWLIWGDVGAHCQNTDGTMRELFNGTVRDMTVINDQVVMALWNILYFYPTLSKPYSVRLKAYSLASSKAKNGYWLASGELGIVKIEVEKESTDHTTLVSDILINSPLRSLAYEMTFSQNKLLVTGGGRGADNLNNPGTLMVYENGQWYNFDDKAIAEETKVTCRDFITPVVDPRDPNRYFVSSWGEGIYEFQDNKLVDRYTDNNSSLGALSGGRVRVYGMTFDSNNNLFVTNEEAENGISMLSAGGVWESIYIPSLSLQYLHSIHADRQNNKWITRARGNTQMGLTVLKSDGTYYFSSNFTDQSGVSVGAATYNCVAQDLLGTIWVGTDNGPIRLSNAESVSSGQCSREILKDENGTNYRLLDGKNITAIAIDGGNRKWFGTTGSGLFMVDNSGSETTVENFTTKNSLIISDNITSIAINNITGEVFVGTDKGLVSYQSDAIAGKSDYSNVHAFPNPVYPDRHNKVIITGLMSDSEIKITDMAGNLIQKGNSIGGQYTWNLADNQGRIVKAGIYLVFAAQEDGSSGVATKVMVIR